MGLMHSAVAQAMRDTSCCTEEIIWPTLTGWAMVRCWKTGPHDTHTDDHGAPLCTTDEARLMREQHALTFNAGPDDLRLTP
jgi:hypothetical protein